MCDTAAALDARAAEQLTGEDARREGCLEEDGDRFDFEDHLYAQCKDFFCEPSA